MKDHRRYNFKLTQEEEIAYWLVWLGRQPLKEYQRLTKV